MISYECHREDADVLVDSCLTVLKMDVADRGHSPTLPWQVRCSVVADRRVIHYHHIHAADVL